MDLEKLHERNELVTVFWPGGPYDFTLEFQRAEAVSFPGSGWEDWFLIKGVCVKPEGIEFNHLRTFYVHPVEGGYELLPMRRNG